MSSEIIDIRRFRAQDFKPLLETEGQAWSATLRWDFSASAQMISACLNEQRLPGYALVEKQRIRGYCFFFYEGEKGLIGNLFVDPSPTQVEDATRLLEHVLETLLGTPGMGRVEAQLPHFLLEQVEPCFRAREFVAFRRRFMAVSLGNSRRPGPAGKVSQCPDTFAISRWERKHDRGAAQLLSHTYRDHVDALINDQYLTPAGSSRLIENIMQNRGSGECLKEVSLVAVHKPTQKLAGILALTAVRGRTAHIPQITVAREFQGHGLGTTMMEKAFGELARQGYQEVSLTVTDLNAGAIRLYERLGFETFREFGAFVWNRA